VTTQLNLQQQGAPRRPLLLHVVYRFDTGGLENGVVNLINGLDGYEHAVVALDRCVPAFCERVTRHGVRFISLHKPPGQGLKLAPAMARELRELRPAIVHTRNLAALEMQLPTWWVGGSARVHGEHGWGSDDPQGLSPRHRWMRRLFSPFVQHYVALSGDLERYLVQRVGVSAQRVTRICNGVDISRFASAGSRLPVEGSPFNDPALFVVGTVGRMQAVKDQLLLAEAFIALLAQQPELATRLRLVLVGDGPMRARIEQRLQQAGVAALAWLPGERRDVPQLMQGLDLFVLPSQAEGISNTILEAMACGLPVLATAVGGNPELVDAGVSGWLVPAGDPAAMAAAIDQAAADPQAARRVGAAGRQRVESRFSLQAMLGAYDALYRGLLAQQQRA
jgi:sugar transferase (PEP-CTERM/EpsH1 system associated)